MNESVSECVCVCAWSEREREREEGQGLITREQDKVCGQLCNMDNDISTKNGFLQFMLDKQIGPRVGSERPEQLSEKTAPRKKSNCKKFLSKNRP